jgi:hypothetical protein
MTFNVELGPNGDLPQDFEDLVARHTGSIPYLKLYEGPGVFPYGSVLSFIRSYPLDPREFLGSFWNDPRASGVRCLYSEYAIIEDSEGIQKDSWGVVTYMHAAPYPVWRAAAGDAAGDDE